jgi:hypothetical protein
LNFADFLTAEARRALAKMPFLAIGHGSLRLAAPGAETYGATCETRPSLPVYPSVLVHSLRHLGE